MAEKTQEELLEEVRRLKGELAEAQRNEGAKQEKLDPRIDIEAGGKSDVAGWFATDIMGGVGGPLGCLMAVVLLPLALMSCVYRTKAKNAYKRGDTEAVVRYQAKVKSLTKATTATSLGCLGVIVVLVILFLVTVL